MCVVFLSVLVLDFVVFLSRVLYLELMSLRSFSSIVCCMCGHQLPQVLAKGRCTWYSCRLICCFLAYRYLISSFILMLGSCVRQLIKPTLCIAHCISQRPELRVDRSARCLVFECTADRQHRFPPSRFYAAR